MKIINLSYAKKNYDEWRGGTLQKIWHKQFRGIFDEDDLRISLTQPRYHFGEWFVAIHYAKKGYKVLVEKYLLYKSHPKKYSLITQILNQKQIEFIQNYKPRHQPPDLLVYSDTAKKFFVEVKRGNDILNESQKRFFNEIEKKTGIDVIIAYLQPIKQ